ncbi:MAG: hypothetical protein EP330_00890 [Deltaproteobacteria bacterium]|nr:MAG: hypothetical protein EP330_00890 [Deltaproteobacteria bacterium]
MAYMLEDVAYVRAELGARRLSVTAMARCIGVHGRTLRNQLNGTNALTGANARKLREALDERGQWHDLRARDVLVTLGLRLTREEAADLRPGLVRSSDGTAHPPKTIQRLLTVPSWLDTVVLNLEVPTENQPRVEAVIRAARSFGTGRDIKAGCEHQLELFRVEAAGICSGGSLIVAWKPFSRRATFWCRVQFHPGLPGHLDFVRQLQVAARRGYPRPGGPGIAVVRMDPFVDIGMPIGSFFVSRTRARRYRYLEGAAGAETLYVGSRASGALLRCYDAVAKHGLASAHPIVRVELELRPKTPICLWSGELEEFGAQHLSGIRLHASQLSAATVAERALLMLARRDGVAFVRKQLSRESSAALADFDQLLDRASDALPVFDVRDHLIRGWHLALYWLRHRLCRHGQGRLIEVRPGVLGQNSGRRIVVWTKGRFS